MTDLEKTLAYLEDMGYTKLGELPEEGKAGFRNYFHRDLYISCDETSFTFNKSDHSLAGMGYGPPTYWLEEYLKSGREATNFYDYHEDPLHEEDQDEEDGPDWDAPIDEDDIRDMDGWENTWEDEE